MSSNFIEIQIQNCVTTLLLYRIATPLPQPSINSRRMQFAATRHRSRLVAAVKTLAIEKVCEFIALILSGNIYDWSGRSAGRESSFRFVRNSRVYNKALVRLCDYRYHFLLLPFSTINPGNLCKADCCF